MKWLLIVVFYGGPAPWHADQTRVYYYDTLAICNQAKADAIAYGAIRSAQCVEAKKARGS